ncbi:MAG: amphi-Trp domain-containing protein [Longimicrobiales bacterium]
MTELEMIVGGRERHRPDIQARRDLGGVYEARPDGSRQSAASAHLLPSTPMPRKKPRDIERTYTAKQFVSKLRRLADAIESDKRFAFQIGGERIQVPSNAVISVEHERDGKDEEVEFQIRWTNK